MNKSMKVVQPIVCLPAFPVVTLVLAFHGYLDEAIALLSEHTAPVEYVDRIAAHVRMRATAALRACVAQDSSNRDRAPREADARRRLQPFQQLVSSSEHVVESESIDRCSRLTCLVCKHSVPRRGARAWLDPPCRPLVRPGWSTDVLAPTDTSVQVGHQRAHASHSMLYEQRMKIWYCSTCGRYAANTMRSLAMPCKPPTRAGLQNLRRLQRGLYPDYSEAARAFNASRL